jgi:hypothetical protein
MQESTETTIADLMALTPERHKQLVGGIAEQRQRQHDDMMRALDGRRGAAKPPRIYRGRQVLVPGKRKAARHPWADRLHAARTGGFVVDQTHTDSNVIVGSCYGCGHRFGFVAGDPVGESEFEREVQRHQASELDGTRECMTGVTL